jgi:predicted nucleic acid-binding protein
MRLVVADTGPLNYRVLIEAIELLPKLFEKVFTPEAVRAELLDQDAPAVVRAWAARPPGWLDVRTVPCPLMVQRGAHSTLANAKLSPLRGRFAPTWS